MTKINKKNKKSSKKIIRKSSHKKNKRINTHKKNKRINNHKSNILKGGSKSETGGLAPVIDLRPEIIPGGVSFTKSAAEICSKHVDSTFSKIFFSNPDNYDIGLIGEDVEKYDNIVFINKLNAADKIVFSYSKYISKGEFGKIDLYSSVRHGNIVLKTEINDPSIFNDAIERKLAKELLNNGCNIIQEYSIEESACCHYNANTGEEYEIFYYLMEPGVMDLNTLVTSKQPGSTDPLIDPETFKRIIESIIIDLKCLLKKGYYYTDLKLENILVVCDNDKEYRVKLGDIGSMFEYPEGKNPDPIGEYDRYIFTGWPASFVNFNYENLKNLEHKINTDRLYIILLNIGVMYLKYYLEGQFGSGHDYKKRKNLQDIIESKDKSNEYNEILGETYSIHNFKYLTHDKEVMDEIIEEDGWSTGGLTLTSSSEYDEGSQEF
jgi:serine/threonine protein kinase